MSDAILSERTCVNFNHEEVSVNGEQMPGLFDVSRSGFRRMGRNPWRCTVKRIFHHAYGYPSIVGGVVRPNRAGNDSRGRFYFGEYDAASQARIL